MTKRGLISELGLWPRWMGAELAAAYCQIAESTFHERVKAGTYPQGFKDGELVQWDKADLDEAKLAMKKRAKIQAPKTAGTATLTQELEAWTPASSARS